MEKGLTGLVGCVYGVGGYANVGGEVGDRYIIKQSNEELISHY